MLDLAAHIIEQKSADFEPAAFENPYENAVVDHCELRLAEGRLLMFLAIDRASKFTQVAFFSRHQDERRRVPEKGRDCVP